jgi:hypothetical protein
MHALGFGNKNWYAHIYTSAADFGSTLALIDACSRFWYAQVYTRAAYFGRALPVEMHVNVHAVTRLSICNKYVNNL